MDSFLRKSKKVKKNGRFSAIFGLILVVSHIQPYDFDAFAHAGAPLGVE